MSKKEIDKKLIGQVVTEENVTIGLRVEPLKGWNYNDQGDNGVGTIQGIINAKELYNIAYNFVTVMWDNGETYNYPLNENVLQYSNGEVKKTEIMLFLEKNEVYDIFKVTEIPTDTGMKRVTKGSLIQLVSANAKLLTFYYVVNGTVYEISFNNAKLSKVKLRKHNTFYDKYLTKEAGEFAELIETDTQSKEMLLEEIMKNLDNLPIRSCFIASEQAKIYKETDVNTYVRFLSNNFRVNIKGSFEIADTIFGTVLFQKSDNVLYQVYESRIRQYLRSELGVAEKNLTFKEWRSLMEELNNSTIFNKKLKNVILSSNCNKELKEYFKEKPIKIDENFIDFDRAEKKIVFTPKGKKVSFDDYGQIKSVKQTMSPHKFFGKYFKAVGVSEYDVKCFADEIVSSYGEYKIHVVEDGKIGKFYNELKTVSSCMAGKNTSLFKLYDNNPDVFKMFAITLDGELVGRVLQVHAKTIKNDEPFVYFDRLYFGGNEEVVQWFNAYCEKNDFIRRYKNNATDIHTFYNKKRGGVFNELIYVDILKTTIDKNNDFEHHYVKTPYLDTLRYGMHGVLTNNNTLTSIKDKFVNVRPRYSFDRADNEYNTKGYKGWCAINEHWTNDNVVLIKNGTNKLNQTVNKKYASILEDGTYIVK